MHSVLQAVLAAGIQSAVMSSTDQLGATRPDLFLLRSRLSSMCSCLNNLVLEWLVSVHVEKYVPGALDPGQPR